MKDDRSIPDGLTPEARSSRERFLALVRANLEATRKVPLNVLVWGPSTARVSEIVHKRLEIRESLIAEGFNAMFSEDIRADLVSKSGLSEKSVEFEEARAADLIIILVEDAPGALAEAHDFCNHPDIAPNIYVMFPKKYKEGYSAKGAIHDLASGYGGVYWYKDTEVGSCNVLKQALKRAEARRQIRARMRMGDSS